MLIFPIFVVKLKIKIMTSNRVKRNIYFGLGMIQFGAALRYTIDYFLDGSTTLLYSMFTTFITIGLFLLYNKYRKLVKAGVLFGENGTIQ